MADIPELVAAARRWIADDPDPTTRDELAALVDEAARDPAAAAELADRFAGPLEFGTAGLRGPMAAGPRRMNRAVVIRAARGLADYLADQPSGLGNGGLAHLGPADAPRPRVVIGNDARHRSRDFALDTAAVMTAAGTEALLLPDRLPTPVLAYAVRALGADAGVMVTASHNPSGDNGYKVYLGGRLVPDEERGVQIVPPHDAAIAARIAAAPPAAAIARAASGWTDVGPGLHEAYVAAIAAGPPPAAPIRIVHTSLHGVGDATARAALRRAGFTDVVAVAAQQDPDPDFPTVSFPNPEEPGTLDLALALACEVGADVVIANDPDADRCAVALNDPGAGGWRRLHGDELGVVLGDTVARRLAAGVAAPPATGLAPVLVNSLVSSRQLAAIAAAGGLAHRQTLTGFKWMARVPGLAFAYEESVGYCLRPDLVRDKDGLSTAVAVARLVAELKASGRTLTDLLDDLARRHGLYLTSQVAVRVTEPERLRATLAALRAAPPTQLAGSPVTRSVDLAAGFDGLPPTDGLLWQTDRDDRLIVRPSGTEPKIKCYLEVVFPVAADAGFDELTALRATARQRLAALEHDAAEVLARG